MERTLRSIEPISHLVDEDSAAAVLNVEPKTLQAWRCRGVGPRWVKVGRLVKYSPDSLNAWIEAQTVQSTSEVRFMR